MYKQKRFNMVQDIDKNIFKKLIKKDNPIIFDVGAFDGNDSIEFLNIFNNFLLCIWVCNLTMSIKYGNY